MTGNAARTALEEANVAVVRAFIESMGKLDPEVRYHRFMAENCRIRWESASDSPVQWDESKVIVGPAAAAAGAKKYVDLDLIYEPTIEDIYVAGPIVVARRTDRLVKPDAPERHAPVVGVFVVKDNKIAEWVDYLG